MADLKPKVSIVVPFYNVEDYIEKCLDTLKKQILKEIEIILVDDGSKDGSSKIAKKFAKEDKRFIYFKKKNGGLSDARNYGMKYARGEYLAFLDSDDYVDLDMYEKMYLLAKEKDADVVETDFIWEYPNKSIIDISKVTSMSRIIVDIRVVAWNKLYRRSLIEELGVTFSKGLRYEDVDWCYKIIPYVEKVYSVHDTYVHYIQRPNSIANTQNARVREIYQILENAIKYYEEKKIIGRYKNQLEYSVMRIVFGSSFLRAIQIPDKKLRREILDEGYNFVESYFPNWKKNMYLQKEKGLKNFYYKTINRFTYRIYEILFRIVKR